MVATRITPAPRNRQRFRGLVAAFYIVRRSTFGSNSSLVLRALLRHFRDHGHCRLARLLHQNLRLDVRLQSSQAATVAWRTEGYPS